MIVRARFREVEDQFEAAAMPLAEARLLALAYAVEAAVEDGRYRSVAEVAMLLELSRSRLSQVMRRRWATIEAQQQVLGGRDCVVGNRARGGHRLVGAASWIASGWPIGRVSTSPRNA